MPDEPGEVAGPGEESGAGDRAVAEQFGSELFQPEVTAPEVTAPEVFEREQFEAEATGDESPATDPVLAAERRRRLAEVFGDVLPESTRDDRPDSAPSSGADDRWYTENRPPHHGG